MSNEFEILARNYISADDPLQINEYESQLDEFKKSNSKDYFNGILYLLSNYQNETPILLFSLLLLRNVRSLPCEIIEDLIVLLLPKLYHSDERVRGSVVYLLCIFMQFSMQINGNFEHINYIKESITNEKSIVAIQSDYELLSHITHEIMRSWQEKDLGLELFSYFIEPLKKDLEIPIAKCILGSLFKISDYLIDYFTDEEQYADFLNHIITSLIPIRELQTSALLVLENAIRYCYSIIEHIIPALIEIEPPELDQEEIALAFIQLWITICKLEKTESVSFQASFTVSSTLIPYLCEAIKSRISGDICDGSRWTPSDAAAYLLLKLASLNPDEAHPALHALINECGEESIHIGLQSIIILLKTGFELSENDVSAILEMIGNGIESEFQITKINALEAAFNLVFYCNSCPFSVFEDLLNASVAVWENENEIDIAKEAFSVSRIILKKLEWSEREEYVWMFIDELENCPPHFYHLFFNAVNGILSDASNPVDFLHFFVEQFESSVSEPHSAQFYESFCTLLSDLIRLSNHLEIDISEYVEPIATLMKVAVETSHVQSPIATTMDLVLYQMEAFEPFSNDYLNFFCEIIRNENYQEVQPAAICGITTLLSFYEGASEVIPQIEPLLLQFLEGNKVFQLPEDADEDIEIAQKEEGFSQVCKLIDTVLDMKAPISAEFLEYFLNELRITLTSMDMDDCDPRPIISSAAGIVVKTAELDGIDIDSYAILLMSCIGNLGTVNQSDIPIYKSLAQFIERRNLVCDEFADLIAMLASYEDPDEALQRNLQRNEE